MGIQDFQESSVLFFDDFINAIDCFVFPPVCRAEQLITLYCLCHFYTAPMLLHLKKSKNSLHVVKMNAMLAFCSCYDICVSVSASYNQWQEHIYTWKEHNYARNNKKSMFKVHFVLVFSMCV